MAAAAKRVSQFDFVAGARDDEYGSCKCPNAMGGNLQMPILWECTTIGGRSAQSVKSTRLCCRCGKALQMLVLQMSKLREAERR
jgi:hypothetical protein